MRHPAYLIVFLFYFQTGGFGNPVPEQDAFSTLRIYNYHGEINTTNSANNETLSRWTVSGKLSVYNGIDRFVFKLDDVKTSVFNGLQSELHHIQEKEIPDEAKVILQPFDVRKHDVENISIHFLPNEPLWSQNFKKGLASNLDLEVNVIDEKIPDASFQETTLYGRCDVHYKTSSDVNARAIIYERSFRHASCENSPNTLRQILFSGEFVEDYESKTVKTTTLVDRNDTMLQQQMVSVTHLQARSLLDSSNWQNITQRTKLDLLDYQILETEIPIDTSKMTDKRELIYEVGDEPTSGRHSYDTSVAGLTKQFLDNYDIFEKHFIHSPLQHVDMSNHDAIENMFLALRRLDVDGLIHLEDAMKEREDNRDILHFYASLLPYVGTHAHVKYLLPLIMQEEWHTNEMLLQRTMAIFPIFIENYTDELLDDLEVLMNPTHFHLQSTRNAAPLSFASAIAHAAKQGALSKTKNVKYTKLYIQKFIESETYEERMVYLLGLINMDDAFDLHLMNHIITNTTESKHIRTLALAGFKHLVQYSDVTELYDMYWPIVQNKKEPFGLRVGALDLLLSVNLSEEQFNTIIKKYSLHFNDPQDKHLANYLLTSLHSLQNTTHFNDHLGDKAYEALKNIHIPSMTTMSTGNYRLAHTDKNIGAYLQTRVISDPSTNIIDSLQVDYKSYGFSYELNGYSLYLNIEGLFDSLYTNKFLKRLQEEDSITSVPELLAVLKKYNFELKSIFEDKDCHIDVIVFKDNTAVYAAHFDKCDKTVIMHLVDDLDYFLKITLSIQFPLVKYEQMPSDLGTPLQFSYVVEDITFVDVESSPQKSFTDIKYRSTWNCQSWIESYNPFVDTNIATYKHTGVSKAIDLKINHSTLDYLFSWWNKNDTFVVYTDSIIGTSVEDENILKQYCEKCEAYIDIELPCAVSDMFYKYEQLGFIVNMTKEGNSAYSCLSSIGDAAIELFQDEDYKSNIDAFPNAGPIMFLTHALNRQIMSGNEFSRGSYRTLPFFREDTETGIMMAVDFKNFKLDTLNSINKKGVNFTIEVQNKIANHTEVASHWNANYKLVSEPEYIDDTGKKHTAYFATLNFKNVASESNNSYKVCAKREFFFPSIRSDKYSLDPVEPGTGKFIWTISEDLEGEDSTCTNPSMVFTMTDTYSPTDKAEKLKIKQNKEDYDECKENSKDLHFIAPTSACKRISARLTDYDNYKSYLTRAKYPKEEGGEIKIQEFKEPIVQFSRDGSDYLQLVATIQEMSAKSESYHKTFYNPVRFNPIAMAYLDTNSAVPFIATSKCTIAPASIEQFSGKYLPNQNKEWLAFAEGYNITERGLTGHTIDKHHVGFTYRSEGTVFTATVKDGKVQIEMDGKELHKSFASEDSQYKVNFLDENVISISDKKVNIYYNTEYVQVTVNALYSKLLYGVCTQDQ